VRGETIRGDLLEEFHARPNRWWFWRQTLSLVVRYGMRRESPAAARSDSMFETIWNDCALRGSVVRENSDRSRSPS
jgi:hypothetical protein